VRDLRVIGLQRIAEGTVYNYLPVNIGDRLDEQRSRRPSRGLRHGLLRRRAAAARR
jgi:outer membrane protein insertion porin family